MRVQAEWIAIFLIFFTLSFTLGYWLGKYEQGTDTLCDIIQDK